MATESEGRPGLLEGLTVVETPPEPVVPVAPAPEPEPEPEPPPPAPDELAELGLRGSDGALDENRVAEAARMARNLSGFTAALDAEVREDPEACAAVIRVFKRRGATVPPELAEIEAGHKAKAHPGMVSAPVEEDDAALEARALGEAQACLQKNDAVGALRVSMTASTAKAMRDTKKMLEEAQRRIEAEGQQRSALENARQELRDTMAKYPEIAEFDGTRLVVKDKEVFDQFVEQSANKLIPLGRCMVNALKLQGRSERKPEAPRLKGRPAIAGGGTAPATRPAPVPGKAQVEADVEVAPGE